MPAFVNYTNSPTRFPQTSMTPNFTWSSFYVHIPYSEASHTPHHITSHHITSHHIIIKKSSLPPLSSIQWNSSPQSASSWPTNSLPPLIKSHPSNNASTTDWATPLKSMPSPPILPPRWQLGKAKRLRSFYRGGHAVNPSHSLVRERAILGLLPSTPPNTHAMKKSTAVAAATVHLFLATAHWSFLHL